MTTLIVQPVDRGQQLLPLVRAAVDGEIVRLERALRMARERLMSFETHNGVSSEYFIANMAAEDLEGKDDEYVQWAGEYRLMKCLEEKLTHLQDIEHG